MKHKGKYDKVNGFTSVELIIVIIILSILGAAVIYKQPFTAADYSGIASDQLIADIRFLQLKAMGSRQSLALIFTADSPAYIIAGVQKRLPKDTTFLATSTITSPLTFNSLGVPSNSGVIRLSGGKEITVYAITGKVE